MSKVYFNLSKYASIGLDGQQRDPQNHKPNSYLLNKGRFRRGYLPLNLGDLLTKLVDYDQRERLSDSLQAKLFPKFEGWYTGH